MRKTVILVMVLPMAAMLAACGSSGDAPSEQTVAQLFSSEARAEGTVAPAPTQTVARGRGPKSKTKIDTGRTAAPAGSEAAVTPCPTDATMRRRGPKQRDNEDTGRTVIAPVPVDEAVVGRGRGPKEKTKILVGRTAAPAEGEAAVTPCPAPAETPDAARRGGPKGGGRDKILTN